MSDNFTSVVNKLGHDFAELENQAPNTQQIHAAIQETHSALVDFQNYLPKIETYNQIVNRLYLIQQIYRIKIPTLFNTDATFQAVAERSAQRLSYQSDISDIKKSPIRQGLISFDSYVKSKLRTDTEMVNYLNGLLNKISVKGYRAIMNLRELVTNQTIAYAIQSRRSTDKMYYSYLNEEEYLQLLTTKTRYQEWHKTFEHFKANSANPFSGRILHIDFNNTMQLHQAEEAYSRDPLYRAISLYIIDEKNNKLSKPAAWEAYTEARHRFNTKLKPNPEFFKKFMSDWLAMNEKDTSYQTIGLNSNNQLQEDVSARFNQLKFYQGGDASTFSKYVQIQNKKTEKGLDAPVNIGTIYNGLRYIDKVFNNGLEINIEQVKKLFTYTNLKEMPYNIVKASFDEANDYAQEQISKTVAAYNQQYRKS